MKIALVVLNSQGSVERVLLGDASTFTPEATSAFLDRLAVPSALPTTSRTVTVWRVPVNEVQTLDEAISAVTRTKEEANG